MCTLAVNFAWLPDMTPTCSQLVSSGAQPGGCKQGWPPARDSISGTHQPVRHRGSVLVSTRTRGQWLLAATAPATALKRPRNESTSLPAASAAPAA